jgi:hypothetical protein
MASSESPLKRTKPLVSWLLVHFGGLKLKACEIYFLAGDWAGAYYE